MEYLDGRVIDALNGIGATTKQKEKVQEQISKIKFDVASREKKAIMANIEKFPIETVKGIISKNYTVASRVYYRRHLLPSLAQSNEITIWDSRNTRTEGISNITGNTLDKNVNLMLMSMGLRLGVVDVSGGPIESNGNDPRVSLTEFSNAQIFNYGKNGTTGLQGTYSTIDWQWFIPPVLMNATVSFIYNNTSIVEMPFSAFIAQSAEANYNYSGTQMDFYDLVDPIVVKEQQPFLVKITLPQQQSLLPPTPDSLPWFKFPTRITAAGGPPVVYPPTTWAWAIETNLKGAITLPTLAA